MCTSPITIKNPSKNYRPSTDKRMLQVSCGSCPECMSSKQLSWLTRLYYEWQNCMKFGGSCYYYTLTYNNQHLPKKYSVPVFCKRDIQLFFKRLRRNLERVGYNTNFKYFLTSEYGHEHNRPHYHFLLFFYQPATTNFVERQIKHAWCVNNDWKQSIGFIAPGSLGSVVTSVSAMSYVCKYIMKDADFDKYYEQIKNMYKFFNAPTILEGEDEELFNAKMEYDLKQYQPFHMQSHHLGECMLDEMRARKRSLDASRVIIPDTKIDGQYIEVPTPLYIQRKLYYNESCPIHGKRYSIRGKSKETYSVSYVLNDLGIKSRVSQLDKRIEDKVAKLQSYRAIYDTPQSLELLGSSVRDYFNVIDSLLDGRSLRSLCIYDMVYRGRYDTGLNGYVADYERFITSYSLDEKKPKHTMYNNRAEFVDFDDVLDMFNNLAKLESYVRMNSNIDKYNSRQVVLTQTNPTKYRKLRLIANLPLKSF